MLTFGIYLSPAPGTSAVTFQILKTLQQLTNSHFYNIFYKIFYLLKINKQKY